MAAWLFFWPGVAHYDTIAQYEQVVVGRYTDWHPPIMARLWSLFDTSGWTGQPPMFLLQVGLYWAGLGLLAAALARAGVRWPAVATLLVGLWPPFLGWQAVVVKDAQMAGALLAATGVLAQARLSGRPLGTLRIAALVVLLGYAAMVRANAVFAVAPLAAGVIGRWRLQDWLRRFLLITVATLALAPAVNRGVLGAERSGVETVQPLFDIAGIAHRAGPEAVPLLPPQTWRRLEADRCFSSVLWDIFSIGKRCDYIQDGLAGRPHAAIFTAWVQAIGQHPGAYLSHRLAHWNATMRWIVPWRFPQAVPQSKSLPNRFGLASPGPQVSSFDRLAGWLANSPLGAPILGFTVALAVVALARPTQSAAHQLALPLALSAMIMELSFFVISIADDWRYHLWSMLAAALSALLLLAGPVSRRGMMLALAALTLVASTSLAARLTLPPIGDDYEALIR